LTENERNLREFTEKGEEYPVYQKEKKKKKKFDDVIF
jgi:hypothetical protein